jgi:hypothetical protein
MFYQQQNSNEAQIGSDHNRPQNANFYPNSIAFSLVGNVQVLILVKHRKWFFELRNE